MPRNRRPPSYQPSNESEQSQGVPCWRCLPRPYAAAPQLLYMAVPKLAAEHPFYVLDPNTLSMPSAEAATSSVASTIAETADVEGLRPVDVIVCGTVAVNYQGVRLGKGAGYSDIEIGLLADAGLLTEQTTIVTTVHDVQVLDEPLPHADHDFTVDLIVTPTRVITCGPAYRPSGVTWDTLSSDQIAAIPALQARATSSALGREHVSERVHRPLVDLPWMPRRRIGRARARSA